MADEINTSVLKPTFLFDNDPTHPVTPNKKVCFLKDEHTVSSIGIEPYASVIEVTSAGVLVSLLPQSEPVIAEPTPHIIEHHCACGEEATILNFWSDKAAINICMKCWLSQ